MRTSAAKNESDRPISLEFRTPYRIYAPTILIPTDFCASTGIIDRTHRPACFTDPPLLTDFIDNAGLYRQLVRPSIGPPLLYHFRQF